MGRSASLTLLLCLLFAAGCSGGRLGLQVQTPAEGTAGWRLLQSGQGLRAGERYALRVDAETAALLHVRHHAPQGTEAVLYDGPVSPQAPVSLPQSGGLYSAEGEVGADVILVVASRRPLTPAQLQRALAGLAATRDPPPQQLDPRSRGIAEASLQVRMNAQGLATLRFVLPRVTP